MRTLLEQQYAALADWLDEVPVPGLRRAAGRVPDDDPHLPLL